MKSIFIVGLTLIAFWSCSNPRLQSDGEVPPCCGETTLKYAMPDSGLVTVTLYDITGTMVDSVFSGFQYAGPQELRPDLSKLGTGLYYL